MPLTPPKPPTLEDKYLEYLQTNPGSSTRTAFTAGAAAMAELFAAAGTGPIVEELCKLNVAAGTGPIVEELCKLRFALESK